MSCTGYLPITNNECVFYRLQLLPTDLNMHRDNGESQKECEWKRGGTGYPPLFFGILLDLGEEHPKEK